MSGEKLVADDMLQFLQEFFEGEGQNCGLGGLQHRSNSSRLAVQGRCDAADGGKVGSSMTTCKSSM